MNGDGTVSLEDGLLFDASAQNGWRVIAVPALPGGAGIALLALALLGVGRWRLRFRA